ncbi:MAG: hypothetical protein WBF53_05435, partial [Litorimonas sp.]
MTTSQAAIRQVADAMTDETGNLPLLPGIFPDTPAPVIRTGAEGRALVLMRWGMQPLACSTRPMVAGGLRQQRMGPN